MRRRLIAVGISVLAAALLIATALMMGSVRIPKMPVSTDPAQPTPSPVPARTPVGVEDTLWTILRTIQNGRLIAELWVQPAADRPPKKRIIHLLDRRTIPEAEFVKVVTAAADRPLNSNELRLMYEDFLARLNHLQTEQRALLRLLGRNYQWSSVFVECLTEENKPKWLSTMEELKRTSAKFEERRQELAADDKERKDAGGGKAVEYSDAETVERIEFHKRYGVHTRDLINLGAVGRGIMKGELSQGLSLEEEAALQAAENEMKNGEFDVEDATNAPREEAIVQRLLAADETTVVVVLDGRHNLGKWLTTIDRRGVEYVRIKMRSYDTAAKGLDADDWSRFLPRKPARKSKESAQ